MGRPRRSAAGYVGPETLIEADFSKGVVSDADPAALAPGQLAFCTNFMLDKVIPYKRGGSEYYGTWTADTIARVCFAEFPAQGMQEIVAMDSTNLALYYKVIGGIEGGTAPGAIGADSGYLPAQDPVIVPDADVGSTTKGALVWGVAAGNDYPRVYTGGGAAPRTINVATGLSPQTGGRYAVYYKSRLVLASSTTFENRMWFSPAGVLTDVEQAWDIDNSWIDFDFGITGVAALQNSILVFSRNHVERLTGSTPPQTNGVGGDMSHGPILTAAGCSSARSIAAYRDSVIWASPQGVYMSSGVGADNLTEEGGIQREWQDALADWDDTTSTIAGEVIRNFYVVAVTVGATYEMWMCDIPHRVWWKIAPATYNWLTANPLVPGDIYATRDDGHVYNLSSYFEPGPSVKTDADGAGINATLTTRFVNGGQVGLKNFRDVRVLYELTSSTSTPTIDITVTGETDNDSYGTTTLPEGTRHDRRSFPVGATDQGIQLTVTQQFSCDLCRLFGFEIDYRPMPLTRGGAA